MQCDKCGAEAVMHAAYSGLHLCGEHFRRSVESRVRRRIRDDALLSEAATADDPETWLVGLSGGKDSVVLTHLLEETFSSDPRVELVALTVHEGIDGYRDASLEACLELTDDLDIEHEVVSYADEYGVEMDAVAEDDQLHRPVGVDRPDARGRRCGRDTVPCWRPAEQCGQSCRPSQSAQRLTTARRVTPLATRRCRRPSPVAWRWTGSHSVPCINN